jgi:hypothetical protein
MCCPDSLHAERRGSKKTTFQKRSGSVMTITSTNRKDKNAWEIPSLKTYLTSIIVRKKRH